MAREVHVIPVPQGRTAGEAWEEIVTFGELSDASHRAPLAGWANILVEDSDEPLVFTVVE